MKMKKLIALFLLLSGISAYAQTQTDKKADEILKPLITKYKGYSTIQADFTCKIESPQKTVDSFKGSVASKGNKYKLNISNQEVYSDGKTVWTYLKEANEVQVNDVNTKEDAITPSNIFTVYEKGFMYKFVDEKAEAGKTIQTIELVPVDKAKKFFKARLKINKTDKSLVSIKIDNKDGSHMTYIIDKLVPNTPLADGVFVFNKAAHPKVEEVDLR